MTAPEHRDVQFYVRLCRPDYCVMTDVSKDEDERMQALGWRPVDGSVVEIHRKAWTVGDDD